MLFSIFTHLMEVPLGALGWLLWTASKKVEPPHEGDEPAMVRAADCELRHRTLWIFEPERIGCRPRRHDCGRSERPANFHRKMVSE